MTKGAVICGGGFLYFTNAWVTCNLLRTLGWEHPIQLWMLEREFSKKCEKIIARIGVEVCVMQDRLPGLKGLPRGARPEWLLKPAALLQTEFEECLLLDADSNPVANPGYLFNSLGYRQHGAIFWPDVRRSDPDNEAWKILGIEYRDEPEFESGQIVIDTQRCSEPLEMALWMNQRADIFYQHMWGDKDTFRYAWHKYGRPFSIIPHPLQSLETKGSSGQGMRVLCQHDFGGDRVFQHRIRAKWNLLSDNPPMPGCLYEVECREYVCELRGMWNGRIGWQSKRNTEYSPGKWQERKALTKEITSGVWLFADHSPKATICCGPLEDWTDERASIPWRGRLNSNESQEEAGAGKHVPDINEANGSFRHLELGFSRDGVLSKGARKGYFFWDLEPRGRTWELSISGEEGVTATFRRAKDGSWQGEMQGSAKGIRAMLFRIENLYPALQGGNCIKGGSKNGGAIQKNGHHLSGSRAPNAVRVANHANGIGDAVTGLYAAIQLASSLGKKVIYHTRHPEWLARAAHPDVEFTDDLPPDGTVDLNWDYKEQVRYAQDKVAWYVGMTAKGNNRQLKCFSGRNTSRLTLETNYVDRRIGVQRLDFPRYVILSPFAAVRARNWSPAHWQRLAWLLDREGIVPVAIGVKRDEEGISEVFGNTSACWAIDHSSQWVIDAMLGAEAVVGLDSGMIHVAGLLGVPAICVHSHLPPEFLFSGTRSVHSVTPETDCRFCRWQGDRGYNQTCANACSALASVGPERVMEMLKSSELEKTREKFEQLLTDFEGSDPPVQEPAAAQPRRAVADIIAYSYQEGSGIAEAAAINIAAMRASGLIVDQRIWKDRMEREEALMDLNQVYYHHWQPIPAERISNWNPAEFGRAKHIGYWAWETEGYVPAGFRELAPFMSEVWTPSSFCGKIFSKLGRPTFVLPHAVGAHRGTLPKLPSERGDCPMIVLTIFDAPSRLARKNPFASIRVFQKAFRSRLDVRLVVKTHNLSAGQMLDIQKAAGFDSRVEIVNEYLAKEALERLFEGADVLLSLQRSEGFGLNLSKALGRGIPLVTTGWGAHLDYCDQDSAFLVRSKLVPASSAKDPWFVGGKWAEPNEAHAVAQLKLLADMIKDRDPELMARRRKGRTRIAKGFSFQKLQSRIQKRLQKNFGLYSGLATGEMP